jgi:hypothetical protein
MPKRANTEDFIIDPGQAHRHALRQTGKDL